MIAFTQGNLLEANVEAVVNTVNTKGIMGKGIALMFKERFPRNFEAYARACKNGEVRIGVMFVTESKELFGPKWIINFPTKTHWRVKTRLAWVEEGLGDLVRVISDKEIRSIAVPPLGCGNGGLDWDDVRPLIIDALSAVDDLEAVIYDKALGARAHHGPPSGSTPGTSQGRAVMPAQVPAIATQQSDSL